MSETSTETRKPLVGTQTGVVTSDKRDKTVKVTVAYLQKLPKYGKYVKRRSVYQVHDENNDANLGDTVEIAPCRPISKTKTWRLVRVVEKAPQGDVPAPAEVAGDGETVIAETSGGEG